MKRWQKFEVWGMGLVLISLFIQFFLTVYIERDMKESDSMVLDLKLTNIYYQAKYKDDYHPAWDDIEEFVKGPAVEGDGHFRFDEVYHFLTPISMVLFIMGSAFGLWGRVSEHAAKKA